MFWTHLIRLFFLPPGCLLFLLVMAVAIRKKWPRVSVALTCIATAALYLLSLPSVAQALLGSLDVCPPLTIEAARGSGAQVIVVLGGGIHERVAHYQRSDLTTSSLARLRYGLYLGKQTGLPILGSSGNTFGPEFDSE